MATFLSKQNKINDIVTDENSPRNSIWKDVESDDEETMTKGVKPTLSFDETSVAQKLCVPGPNVVFTPKLLPFAEYLTEINKEGTLGCGPKKFPKYENGKYCCVDSRVSNQEQLDYVNTLLEAAIRNVSDTAFSKNKKGLFFLIRTHDYLLNSDKTLVDSLELPEPYTNIMDWYTTTEKRVAQEISSYRPDPEPEHPEPKDPEPEDPEPEHPEPEHPEPKDPEPEHPEPEIKIKIGGRKKSKRKSKRKSKKTRRKTRKSRKVCKSRKSRK